MGFPIRKSTDRRLLGSSPWLIAACYVLHRLLVPRYPPLALSSLDYIKRENPRRHARYAVLKVHEEVGCRAWWLDMPLLHDWIVCPAPGAGFLELIATLAPLSEDSIAGVVASTRGSSTARAE